MKTVFLFMVGSIMFYFAMVARSTPPPPPPNVVIIELQHKRHLTDQEWNTVYSRGSTDSTGFYRIVIRP